MQPDTSVVFQIARGPSPALRLRAKGRSAIVAGRPPRNFSKGGACRRRMTIREAYQSAKTRLAVFPYVLPKLAGFDPVPDRCFNGLHVLPACAAPVLRVQS